MAPKITTPVKGFTGNVAGVAFVDGRGETDDPIALGYFERRGYGVEKAAAPEPITVPEGKPSTDWKVDQLKAYAEKHELDLGSAKSKPELVAAIEKAGAEKAAASTAAGDGGQGGSQE
ncbi:hypothetical protein [Agromyces sp. NBRC 114283]|uniref:hypothetical protein n=1 Tax=Agromyces sp. NBRC 114283 TaxID=2994521 RepID=UPI0024A4F35E|nr:hypothetical protein [Agromyces sp. NBRC 114283]GLU91344.1 hypothetical protein Agsp01_35990 [Agromyces sp. NBRC 114283]